MLPVCSVRHAPGLYPLAPPPPPLVHPESKGLTGRHPGVSLCLELLGSVAVSVGNNNPHTEPKAQKPKAWYHSYSVVKYQLTQAALGSYSHYMVLLTENQYGNRTGQPREKGHWPILGHGRATLQERLSAKSQQVSRDEARRYARWRGRRFPIFTFRGIWDGGKVIRRSGPRQLRLGGMIPLLLP